MNRSAMIVCVAGFCALEMAGCTAGPMNVQERYYISAPGPDNTNYYRITMRAKTEVGVAEFRQGWFPENAVDALFGDVSEENAGKSLATREAIRNQLNDAILKANQQFLAKASDPTVNDKDLIDCSRLRWRVRLAPTAVLAGGKKGPPDGFFDSDRTIEYDPQKGLELNRSDEKFVVVLASNPDEIVSQIRQFAASDNAKKILTQFTDTVVQSRNQEVVQKQASLTLGVGQDQVVVTAAQDALKQLQGTPTRGTALSAVESVLAIMGKQ